MKDLFTRDLLVSICEEGLRRSLTTSLQRLKGNYYRWGKPKENPRERHLERKSMMTNWATLWAVPRREDRGGKSEDWETRGLIDLPRGIRKYQNSRRKKVNMWLQLNRNEYFPVFSHRLRLSLKLVLDHILNLTFDGHLPENWRHLRFGPGLVWYGAIGRPSPEGQTRKSTKEEA